MTCRTLLSAADSLQDLRTELCSTQDHIMTTRRNIARIDAGAYATASKVKVLQQRRHNLEALEVHLKGLQELRNSQSAAQCLLEAQDWGGALELFHNMEGALQAPLSAGAAPVLFDLLRFSAVRPFISRHSMQYKAVVVHLKPLYAIRRLCCIGRSVRVRGLYTFWGAFCCHCAACWPPSSAATMAPCCSCTVDNAVHDMGPRRRTVRA